MLKYNNIFTHTYIYYSEGKSKLNNKNEIDKHNNRHYIVVCMYVCKFLYIYSFIVYSMYSVTGCDLSE